MYLNSVAAKNKDIFHNPEVFDPERWVRDKPNPFALLLFGFGPRMCYGELGLALQAELNSHTLTQTYLYLGILHFMQERDLLNLS